MAPVPGWAALRRLLPLLAGAQALGILLADRGLLRADAALVLGATALGLGLVAGRRAQRAGGVALALAAGGLGLAGRLEDAERQRPERSLECLVEGRVLEAVAGPVWARVDLVDVVPVDARGPIPPRRVRLLDRPTPPGIPALERALPGERVRAQVRLREPHARRNPGGRASVRDLERQGIGALGRLVHPALHVRLPEREGLRPLAPLRRARADVSRRLTGAGPGGPLLAALALGDRRALPPETREAFARLGLAHLLAVSGLHLTLVASLAFAACRLGPGRSAWLAARWDSRSVALVASLACAGLYALAAGWGVPVRRALVLLVGLGVAIARARPGARFHPLAAAAVVVLAFEPAALFAPGAQLSFAASAALLGFATFGEREAPEGRAARLRRAGERALGASATALVAAAPLAAWHLGRVAPWALAANLVAIPWTAAALLPAALLGAAAAGLEPTAAAGPLLAVAERVGAASAAGVEAAAAWLPALPPVARPSGAWLVGLLALVALALRARRVSVRALLALAVHALLALSPPAPIAPPPPRLVALEVGQGDATLVQGRAAAVLVDAGAALPGGSDRGERDVVPALRALGIERLDRVVVTHADADHRGGVPAVLASLPVAAVWLPHGGLEEPDFAAVIEAARSRRIPLLERGAGSPPERVGDLVLHPLWPPAGGATRSRNDASLVVRVEAGSASALLPGDVGAEAETALLAGGAPLRSDVLLLPHHGSRFSSTLRFLEAVDPRVAIASAPCAGRFEMPHPLVRERVRAVGAAQWWTGRDGAVLVGLGEPLAVYGFADAAGGARRACRARGVQ